MKPLSRHLSRLSLLGLAALLGPGCLLSSPPGTTPSKDPCTPNPCTQSGKTTCANDNGTASCLCDSGTVLRPNGTCEAVTAANCPEHPGDATEPDDCLARASVLTPTASAPRQQSIDPVGDYDFFRIDATGRTVYVLTAQTTQGSLLPRVDVFDQTGKWVKSQEGVPQAQLGFKARSTAPYYVRVSHSPVDPSTATGVYTLALANPVLDDYGDSADEATSLTPATGGTAGTSIPGVFEYGQDTDWFVFTNDASNPKTLYRVEFDTTSTGFQVPALSVFINGGLDSPLVSSTSTYVEFKAGTSRFYLALSPAKGAPGNYAFKLFKYAQ